MRISDWSSDVCSSDLEASGWQHDRQTLQRTEIVALRFRQADDQREALVAIEQLAGFLATRRRRQNVLHVADVEAVAVQRRTFRFDRQDRQAGDLFDLDRKSVG